MSTALVPPADKVAFMQTFNVMAKRLRASDIDAADLQTYFSALCHLPMWALEQGADALALERGRRFFPTTAEWHDKAQDAIERRLREVAQGEREWKLYCDVCQDSGWKPHACTAKTRCGRRFCDRMGETYEHEYMSPCPCREHNPSYQRDVAATRAKAAQAGKAERK